MSSTNRGAKRQKDDYYRTPLWAVQDMIRAVRQDFGDDFFEGEKIMDPSAGGDPANPKAAK